MTAFHSENLFSGRIFCVMIYFVRILPSLTNSRIWKKWTIIICSIFSILLICIVQVGGRGINAWNWRKGKQNFLPFREPFAFLFLNITIIACLRLPITQRGGGWGSGVPKGITYSSVPLCAECDYPPLPTYGPSALTCSPSPSCLISAILHPCLEQNSSSGSYLVMPVK